MSEADYYPAATPDAINAIEGASRLVDAFGGFWPDFHDAEVLSLAFEREDPVAQTGTRILANIHVWAMTDRVDEHGMGINEHESRVVLEFRDVEDVMMEGFNYQNVLGQLRLRRRGGEVAPTSSGFDVHFRSIFGLEAIFRCAVVAVLDVRPWDGVERASAV